MSRPLDFKYKGQRVAVQTQLIAGCWRGSYAIGGGPPFVTSAAALASEAEALAAAARDAKDRIDMLAKL